MESNASFNWPSVVPWFLVALGWVVVNAQNNSREKRKEVRAKVDSIIRSVREIEELAIMHHIQAQDDLRCMKIKRDLARVSREISIVRAAGLRADSCITYHRRLRQSITLSNFETSSYEPLPLTSNQIADISATSESLRFQLEKEYFRKFQQPVYSRIFGE